MSNIKNLDLLNRCSVDDSPDICSLLNSYQSTEERLQNIKYGTNYEKLKKCVKIKEYNQKTSANQQKTLEEKTEGTIVFYLDYTYAYLKWIALILFAIILYIESRRYAKGNLAYYVTVGIFIAMCLLSN